MRKLAFILSAGVVAVAIAFALYTSLAGAAEPSDLHCDAGGVKTEAEGDELMNGLVLEEGTIFCVKAGPRNTGTLVADGESTLCAYLIEAGITAGRGDTCKAVSYYTVYLASTPTPSPAPTDTPTSTPTPTPTSEPTATPTSTPVPTSTPEPTPTPTSTPMPPEPTSTPTTTPLEPTPTVMPEPTPASCADDEERLTDGTCQFVPPLEEFPPKATPTLEPVASSVVQPPVSDFPNTGSGPEQDAGSFFSDVALGGIGLLILFGGLLLLALVVTRRR